MTHQPDRYRVSDAELLPTCLCQPHLSHSGTLTVTPQVLFIGPFRVEKMLGRAAVNLNLPTSTLCMTHFL